MHNFQYLRVRRLESKVCVLVGRFSLSISHQYEGTKFGLGEVDRFRSLEIVSSFVFQLLP